MLDILSTSAVNNSNIEACCVKWCDLSLACHHKLTWALGCQERLNPAFSIPSIWFSFINLSERANGFASSSHCSFLLMSPLLAQGPPMRADRNSHILRIIAQPLLPPQSSRAQWAGCVARGCVGAVPTIPRALGESFPDPCLPSFTGKTRSISSPSFSFMWLNNRIYVKAIVSLAHLFLFSFQL